jgi:hypothetical protein
MDPHSTGEKVIRFGQQTNLCVGFQLMHDSLVAVTVDCVIRSFSISKREMLGSFKISELGSEFGEEERKGLHQIGGVSGGGAIVSFGGFGRYMTVSRGGLTFDTLTVPSDNADEVLQVLHEGHDTPSGLERSPSSRSVARYRSREHDEQVPVALSNHSFAKARWKYRYTRNYSPADKDRVATCPRHSKFSIKKPTRDRTLHCAHSHPPKQRGWPGSASP